MSGDPITDMTRNLQGVPDTIEGNVVRSNVDAWLRGKLDGRQACSADHDNAVVLVALESDKTVLYRFRAPRTVSREVLQLGVAVIRTSYELGDDVVASLSIDLPDGALQVRSKSLAGAHLDELRDELEKRVARLGH